MTDVHDVAHAIRRLRHLTNDTGRVRITHSGSLQSRYVDEGQLIAALDKVRGALTPERKPVSARSVKVPPRTQHGRDVSASASTFLDDLDDVLSGFPAPESGSPPALNPDR